MKKLLSICTASGALLCCTAVCWLTPPTGPDPAAAFVQGPRPDILTLRFKNKVGAQALRLLNETYTDPFGEPMTIYKFKYYVSHISVITEDNTEHHIDDGDHLVDEADTASKTIVVPAPALPLKAIIFLLGVDSVKNISGAQTGDLDPLKGMFWTWNTGYVDAELEGRSDSSHANEHFLSWHVGGFKQHQNAAREIRLPLNGSFTAGTIPGGAVSARTIIIDADILKWFNGRGPIHIAQAPVCHEPGPLAMSIADNYASMFSIEK
jgi:hypothetical protein